MNNLHFIQKMAIWALPVLFAITIHEVAHGWVASRLGDQTAKKAGRLTLNPIKHLDPVGTVLIPVLCLSLSNFLFGWAKPVPVNPNRFKHIRRDSALVALAGPLSNLVMAFLWGAIAKLGFWLLPELGPKAQFLVYTGWAGVAINVMLMVLNLIPLPPLDGGRVLHSLLPSHYAHYLDRIEPYGFIILLLLLGSGLLSRFMMPFLDYFHHLIRLTYGL